MKRDHGTFLAIGAVAALAALGARRARGSRSLSVDEILVFVPELRMRWYNASYGEAVVDPEEVDDFYLSDHPYIPPSVKSWWEEKTGTRYIGHGNYRVVFSVGDGTVVKLALDNQGQSENQNEVDSWNEYHDTPVGQMLAPMIEGDEGAVVMRQAVPLSKRMFELNPSIEADFRKADRRFNELAFASGHNINDTAALGNWGVLDGKIVLIDYPEEI